MDAYQPRCFAGAGAGAGEPPPPPLPSHLHHHQQPNPHWYPPPPQPYPPHTNHHFPPPPPPPQHQQWGPPPDRHHHLPPPPYAGGPPPPYSASPPQPYGYHPSPSPPPPPPQAPANPWLHHAAGPPPPPPHAQPGYPPPPPSQAWANPSWAHNQVWEYTDRNFTYNNEEDWATKAKAWAAAKSVTENNQTQQHVMSTGRAEDHHYAYRDQYQLPAGPPTETLRPSVPQSSNEQLPVHMAGQQNETNYLHDIGPVASPAKSFGSFPPTYEQEVSYNYSSTPGNWNAMLQYSSSQVQPSPTASSVQDGFPRAPPNMPVIPTLEQPHFVQDGQSSKLIVDPSDQPLEFNNRPAPDMGLNQTISFGPGVPAGPVGLADSDAIATSTHSWPPSATAGFFPRASLPPQGTQMDPAIISQPSLSVHAAPLFGGVSGPNYRPGVPPAAFGVGSVTSLHPTEDFPADANGPFNVAERSKKPPVPNWLREELLKNKSVLASTPMQQSAFHSVGSEDADKALRRADQSDSKSINSAKSTEDDEDDEDEVEAARTAAINQEIKRVLTEVLLKVTDDLFDEIVTKVLNEDDSPAEANVPASVMSSRVPDLAESAPRASAKVLVPAKTNNNKASGPRDDSGPSSPKGALLGLASYDSDDDNDDDDDDDDGDDTDAIILSNLPASDTTADTTHHQKGMQSIDGGRDRNHNERNPLIQSTSSLEDYKLNNEKLPRRKVINQEGQLPTNEPQNGEIPSDSPVSLQPKDIISTKDEKALEGTEDDSQNGRLSSGNHSKEYKSMLSNHRYLEKSSNKEDSVKEVKVVDRTEHETSTAENDINHEDKYSMKGRIDKKDSSKEKGPDGNAKHGADIRDSYSRGTSKHHDAKGDRKDFSNDARERNREDADRRRERGKNEQDDRSRQVTKGSASHGSKRSPSPRGSRTRKENSSHFRGSVSSDEPSDNSKRRKLHSHKNSLSPSPPKSQNRKVSRSPHSKHSHRRHSPHTSTDRKRRSRSRSPVKRR